jgi:hypothetical protein
MRMKKTYSFLSPTPLLVHSVPPVPYLFHSSYLPPVFILCFSPSLSLLLFHFPHVLTCLSRLIAHSTPSFLSFHIITFFSLLVPTSKSRHHFSFFCTFSLHVLRNLLCHTPFFLACLCLCPFRSALHSSIFLSVILIFPFLHWQIRFSLSFLSLCLFFSL